jgi:hypothetical protein
MKKIYIVLLVLGVLLFVAAMTNPDVDTHRGAVSARVKPAMIEFLQEDDASDQAAMMAPMLAGLAVDNYVSQLVSSRNYILFSTTEVTWLGESRTIGIGAFGNVYLSDKLDRDAIHELLEKSFN